MHWLIWTIWLGEFQGQEITQNLPLLEIFLIYLCILAQMNKHNYPLIIYIYSLIKSNCGQIIDTSDSKQNIMLLLKEYKIIRICLIDEHASYRNRNNINRHIQLWTYWKKTCFFHFYSDYCKKHKKYIIFNKNKALEIILNESLINSFKLSLLLLFLTSVISQNLDWWADG